MASLSMLSISYNTHKHCLIFARITRVVAEINDYVRVLLETDLPEPHLDSILLFIKGGGGSSSSSCRPRRRRHHLFLHRVTTRASAVLHSLHTHSVRNMSTASMPTQCPAPHMPAASHSRLHRRQRERRSTTQHTHLGLGRWLLENEATSLVICDLKAAPIRLHKLALRRRIHLEVARVLPAENSIGTLAGPLTAPVGNAPLKITLVSADTSQCTHAQMSAWSAVTWCTSSSALTYAHPPAWHNHKNPRPLVLICASSLMLRRPCNKTYATLTYSRWNLKP